MMLRSSMWPMPLLVVGFELPSCGTRTSFGRGAQSGLPSEWAPLVVDGCSGSGCIHITAPRGHIQEISNGVASMTSLLAINVPIFKITTDLGDYISKGLTLSLCTIC